MSIPFKLSPTYSRIYVAINVAIQPVVANTLPQNSPPYREITATFFGILEIPTISVILCERVCAYKHYTEAKTYPITLNVQFHLVMATPAITAQSRCRTVAAVDNELFLNHSENPHRRRESFKFGKRKSRTPWRTS